MSTARGLELEQNTTDIYATVHRLCYKGDLEEIKRRFSQLSETHIERALSLKQGQFEFTPIHAAATNGRAELIDYLLTRSCTQKLINTQTANHGYTPLHLAVVGGHVHCVRVLLKHGADIRITDRGGKTAKQRGEAKKFGDIVRILRSKGKLSLN